MTSYFWIYQAAFIFHLAALAAYWVYATNPKRQVASAALNIFTLGTVLQASYMAAVWINTGQTPLVNSFQALALWTLTVSLVFMVFEWRWRLGLPGAFIAPLTVLTLFMGFRFSQMASQESAVAMHSFWLLVHVALSMFGYAAFTLAFAVALAFLLQERQLKTHQLGSLFYELPSLVELEKLVFVTVRTGVLALGLGLLGGLAWKAAAPNVQVGMDPKVNISLAVLGYFSMIWLLRQKQIIVGRKSAYAILLGFISIFFGFYLANTIGGGHGF